jgi:uncharacterized protein YggE
MKNTTLFIIACVICMPLSLFAQRTITVTGSGSVSAKPDYAIITLMTTSQNNTAQTVFSQSDETSSRLMKSLSDAGVATEDVTERTFALNPTYDYSGGGGTSPKLVGYHMMKTYEVKVRNLKTLPVVLDAGSMAGASNITIERYDINNREKIKGEAVKNAIEDAREEAGRIAREMGASLGEIVSISDSESSGAAAPMGFGREEEEERRGPGLINPHEIKKKVEVKVTFSVK